MRLDFERFSKVERTPQGGFKIPANLTRVGVFVYRRADGSERRELRHPEEVFSEDSLSTLAAAPVTDLHPRGPVTPGNWKALAVGHVGETVEHDEKFVSASLMLQDDTAIKAVERGDRKELSCGYTCHLDPTPGEWNGERYDAIQRGIKYNHVALGPGGWGRAGRDVALRLDSDDAVQVSADPPPIKPKGKSMTIRIDGVDFEAGSPQHLQAVEKRHDAQINEIKNLKSERDELQGKLDAADKERNELQEKIDSALDPATLDAKVAERVALHAAATKVLGPETKIDGKSEREVMVDVIKHDDSGFDASDKSDDYVRGRFESTLRAHTRNDKGGSGIGAARAAATEAPREDASDLDPVTAARTRMLKQNAEVATKPLQFARRS